MSTPGTDRSHPIAVAIADVPVVLAGPDAAALYASLSAAPTWPGQPAADTSVLRLHAEQGSITPPTTPPDHTYQHLRTWDLASLTLVSTAPDQFAEVTESAALLDPGASPRRGLHTLLLPVLARLFSQRGHLVLHSAGLLVDGQAVVALAGSGQGKSTLVTAALTAGHGVLSDDLIVLRRSASGLEVAGIPVPLALPADLSHAQVVGEPLAGDARARHAVAAGHQLRPGWHPLAATILIEHSQTASGHLLPAEPAAAFHRAMGCAPDGIRAETAKHAFTYAAALRRLPAWHLGHAADPDRRLDHAAQRLSEIAAALG